MRNKVIDEDGFEKEGRRMFMWMRLWGLAMFLLGLSFCYVVGYTNNWVESTPTDATVANQIDDFNRKVRVDVAERLETYIGGFNAGDSNAGFYHVLFIENAASLSTPAADKGLLYGKLIDSKCELVWLDEDGDEKQITSDGVLKISAGDFDANAIDEDDIELSNDSWLKAMNNAGDGDANLIKLNTSDVPVIATDAELQTAIDVNDNDNAISDKKYVDDQIAAAVPDDDAFSSTYASKSNNTPYEAATDGFVLAINTNLSTLSISTSTTEGGSYTARQTCGRAFAAPESLMCPVAKGLWWKTTAATTVYWVAVGG